LITSGLAFGGSDPYRQRRGSTASRFPAGLTSSAFVAVVRPNRLHCPERPIVTAASLEPSRSDLVTFQVTTTDSSVHLRVAGEIDSSSAPALRAELTTVLDLAPAELVLDLCAVSFLDSAGLSVLAAAHRRATAEDVRLRVLVSGRAVVRPLQITGLWQLLEAELVEPDGGTDG
jgi:anti-sigma B factor antagonist